MRHAEALYAYNQYAAMQQFIDGAEMALTLGVLNVKELPELLEIHSKACEKAIQACHEYGWRDFTPQLEKQLEVLTNVRRGIVVDLRRWQRQKQR